MGWQTAAAKPAPVGRRWTSSRPAGRAGHARGVRACSSCTRRWATCPRSTSGSELGAGGPDAVGDQFGLEGVDEALREGVETPMKADCWASVRSAMRRGWLSRAIWRIRQRRISFGALALCGAALDVVACLGVDHAVVGRSAIARCCLGGRRRGLRRCRGRLAAGRFDPRGAAKRGQRAIVAQPRRVVASDQQHACGDLRADAGLFEQTRR